MSWHPPQQSPTGPYSTPPPAYYFHEHSPSAQHQQHRGGAQQQHYSSPPPHFYPPPPSSSGGGAWGAPPSDPRWPPLGGAPSFPRDHQGEAPYYHYYGHGRPAEGGPRRRSAIPLWKRWWQRIFVLPSDDDSDIYYQDNQQQNLNYNSRYMHYRFYSFNGASLEESWSLLVCQYFETFSFYMVLILVSIMYAAQMLFSL